MTITTSLLCDFAQPGPLRQCPARFEIAVPATSTNAAFLGEARRAGWVTRRLQHFCPDHRPTRGDR